MGEISEHNILLFLLQVALLLGTARLLGEVFRRFGQPAITAEILVGVVFGPTVLGRVAPGWHTALFPDDPVQLNMLETVAWLGILLFLLRTGLETSLAAAWRLKGEAAKIAFSDLILPMAIAFVPAYLLPDQYLGQTSRLLFAVFVATIMTISALPVTARVLQDLHIFRTDTGFLTISALTINDVAGWVVFAMILGTVSDITTGPGSIWALIVFSLLFAAVFLTLGRWVMNRAFLAIQKYKLPDPGSSLTLVFIAGLVGGALTTWIGIHALFGFFIAGIMAGEAQALSERTRHIFTEMVHAILVPIFFASIGLRIDFLANFNAGLIILILTVGVAGRFIGAWVGCAWASTPRPGRALIGMAHVPGGEMQIVIGMLAMEAMVIGETVYVAIIFGAVMSSVIAGPGMRWAVRRMRRYDWRSFLTSNGIVMELRAATRLEAIDELSHLAARLEGTPDPGPIAGAVRDREALMSTSLEHGIAVPHARIPGMDHSVVVLGRSLAGIEWNSRDGHPARLIFLILTAEEDSEAQLQILRGIATALRDANLRERLLGMTDPSAMIRAFYDGSEQGHPRTRRRK